MDFGIAVYRLKVAKGAHVDTLSSVITPWPVVVGDTMLLGVRLRQKDSTRELFQLRFPERRLRTWKLPEDVQSQFTDVSISPDGKFLAYVAATSNAMPYAAVRLFPDGREWVRGPVASGCECDVDMNQARWVSADSFEIAAVNTASGQGWILFAGSASLRRVHIVLVDQEPD